MVNLEVRPIAAVGEGPPGPGAPMAWAGQLGGGEDLAGGHASLGKQTLCQLSYSRSRSRESYSRSCERGGRGAAPDAVPCRQEADGQAQPRQADEPRAGIADVQRSVEEGGSIGKGVRRHVGATRVRPRERGRPTPRARPAPRSGGQTGLGTPRAAWTLKFSPDWSIARWISRARNSLSATAPTMPSGTS
jgi:hypothetical protein